MYQTFRPILYTRVQYCTSIIHSSEGRSSNVMSCHVSVWREKGRSVFFDMASENTTVQQARCCATTSAKRNFSSHPLASAAASRAAVCTRTVRPTFPCIAVLRAFDVLLENVRTRFPPLYNRRRPPPTLPPAPLFFCHELSWSATNAHHDSTARASSRRATRYICVMRRVSRFA